jgi:hypothetical protein
LRIARDLRDAGALVRELMDVRSVTKDSGEHDDLVLAASNPCGLKAASWYLIPGPRPSVV